MEVEKRKVRYFCFEELALDEALLLALGAAAFEGAAASAEAAGVGLPAAVAPAGAAAAFLMPDLIRTVSRILATASGWSFSH